MQGSTTKTYKRNPFQIALLCAAFTLGLLATAPPAGAVTIGQLAPGTSPPALCGNGPVDVLQATVTSGTAYVVPPGVTTITSWSTNAAAGAGQTLKFKVFRKTAEPNQYMVVAHDGPRALTPSALNTFPVNIAVQPGDVIGNNDQNASTVNNACDFSAPGETTGERFFPDIGTADLADGASGDFVTANNSHRVNVSAVVLDTTPPQTVIAAKKIKGTTAKFTFTSSEPGSTFQCKLDKRKFKPCSSPKKYKHLSPGKHKFKVRAVDVAGNIDATPAKKKFKI
jgi:hypothetical protein